LGIIGRSLKPYILGADYSIADTYLYMLASWYPGERSELLTRVPELQAHAKLVSARPAVSKVEADHAQ
jgi:glutathione S-transferase